MVCKWLKNVEWGSLESTLLESGYNQHQRLTSESALKIRLIRMCLPEDSCNAGGSSLSAVHMQIRH